MTGFSAVPLGNEESAGRYDMQWRGRSEVRGPKWAKMPLLTIGMLGLQVVWSVEMGYASPYLLSLGLSKSLMSIVFVAGPLSGLIVQPLIGVLADRSKSRFGRRRPYIVAGVLICIVAMLVLGFTRNLASIVTPASSTLNNFLTILLAIVAIYLIDFSINAVQAADRALLVDLLPVTEQELGNAWAGRMFGLGSVAGFFVGNIELPTLLPFLGQTQLQVLSVITGIVLLLTHIITGFSVREKILVSSGSKGSGSIWTALKDIWSNATKLPPTIQRICMIQFFSWIGWFPVLFFSPILVGDLYKQSPAGRAHPSAEAMEEEAARLSSRALLWSSLISFAASVLLPFLICHDRRRKQWFQVHLSELWTFSHALFSLCMGATLFANNIKFVMALISVTGFCWAITQWAPFSLLGEAILSESIEGNDGFDEIIMTSRHSHGSREDIDSEETVQLVREDKEEHVAHPSPSNNSVNDREQPPEYDDDEVGVAYQQPQKDNISDRAGIILGIHNAYIVIPQFLVTGLSSILFAVFEPGKSALPVHRVSSPSLNETLSAAVVSGANTTFPILFARDQPQSPSEESSVDTTGLIFRIGGFCSLIACILCWRLSRSLKGM